jgi:hypothetical protein
MEDRGWKIKGQILSIIFDPPSSILHPRSSISILNPQSCIPLNRIAATRIV